MPFKNSQTGYPWSLAGVLSAPSASGVYGIFNRTDWIYIGESSDIAARLSEHFNGSANSNPDILPMKPTGFIFELVPAVQRVQREYLLIVELKPRANRK